MCQCCKVSRSSREGVCLCVSVVGHVEAVEKGFVCVSMLSDMTLVV